MDLRGSGDSRRSVARAGLLLALVVSSVVVQQPNSPLVSAGVAAAAPATTPTSSAACTTNWTGGAHDQSWASGGNWSGGGVPSASDVACVGGGFGTVILDAGYGQLFPAGSVFVDPGSSLSLGRSILFLSDAAATSVIADLAITNYYGGIDGPGSIEIPTGGSWTWSSGGARGLGAITIDAGATATIDAGTAVVLYLYRHITVHGHLTITTAGAPYYATFGVISQQPASATDAGGLLTADGAVDLDASLVELQIGSSGTDAIDFSSVTSGHVGGGHRVELFGVNGFGGNWTVDPSTVFKVVNMPRTINATANVLVNAKATFGIGYGDAHLSGAVSGPGTFCPEYGTVFLDNVHALDSISRVDTGECDGTFIGAGRISVPRGQTATVQQLRTSFDSLITGGGTLEIVGDGVATTTDLVMGGNYGRGGFAMRDATVVIAHGASASFGAGASETIYSPDATAPADAETSIVNHGTVTWNSTLVATEPRTRFDNAADGVVTVVAAKADSRGPSAGFSGIDSTFTNEGLLQVTAGDFLIDGRRHGPSLLGGQIDVAPGSVLMAMSPHITGTLDLHGGDAATPGGALQADGDNIVLDGTLRLGSRSTVTDAYYDFIVHPTGVVHADIDGPQGTLTGQITTHRTVNLGGRLDVTTLAGYQPTTSPINILTAPTVTGTFSTFTSSPLAGGAWSAVYSATTAGVVATGQVPVIDAPSTVTVEAGSGNVIFTVTATASATLTVAGLPDGVVFVESTGWVVGSATVAGTYVITYTAINGIGSSTATTTLVVTAPSNRAPIVHATVTPSTGTIYAPATVRLDLTGTTDPDGNAELDTWSVSISDGTTTTAGPSGGPATMIAPHDITLPVTGQDATFTITVSVTDVQGGTGTKSVTVTVLAPQVQATFSSAPSTAGAHSVDFHPSITGRDVADAAEWTLDFGDGIVVLHGTMPIPSTISHSYPTAGNYTAVLTVTDASGHVLATFSAQAGATNQSPHAVFDLSTMATTTSPPVLVYQSDNAKPLRLSSPSGFVVIDGTRSSDPDGPSDIATWDVQTTREGTPFDHFTGTGPITSAITTSMPGATTTETTWTVRVAITDRAGATSLAVVTLVVPSYQRPVSNRPPVAILPTVRVNSASGGVVSADPGLSYDPDAAIGDAIKSWTVDLIDLDSKVTKVDSGTGQPPRAVPVKLPNDLRGGSMFIRLTVTDTNGATGQTLESIRFNTCDATAAVALPYDTKTAGDGKGTADGPAAWLDLALSDPTGALPSGSMSGRAPLKVTFTDRSFGRGAATIVSHSLADVGTSDPSGYGRAESYQNLDAPAPITDTLTFTNDLNRPVDYTFALLVTDAFGVSSKQFVTVIVLPPSSPVLSLTINKSAKDPRAIEVTPNAVPSLDKPAWQLVTSGLGSADVARTFDSGTALSKQVIVVPRDANTPMTGQFRFGYGEVNDPAALTLCEPRPLPLLTQTEANKNPTLDVTPGVQHTTGTAHIRVVAADDDPAPLGAADAALYGLKTGDLAGLVSLTIDGDPVNFELAGATTGTAHLDVTLDVPPPPPGSGPGPRAVSIVVRDAWGGSASASVLVYDDPPSLKIDNDTLTLTHTPNNLNRAGSTTETISLTGTQVSNAPVVLAVDVPVEATASSVTTDVLGSTGTVSAVMPKQLADRWMCTGFTGATANRLICTLPALTNPMPRLYVRFSTVTQKAILPIVAGVTQAATGQSVAAAIASVRDVTALDTLRLHAQDNVTVIGLVANAGPDQSVPDVTVQPNGSRTAAHVTLDGSLTAGDGRPLTFTWTQLNGTPVTWTSPTTINGSTVTVDGQQVQFDAPFLRLGGTATFRLTVSAAADGTRPATTSTDQVAITFAAPPDRAPVISSLTATPDATLATPARGTQVVLAAGATDPDGDSLSYSWRAWRGTASTGTAVATTARTPSSQRNLTWPTGVQQLTVEVTANDGRGQTTVRQLVLGTPIPPVHISITGTVAGTPLVTGPPPTAAPGAAIDLTAVTDRSASGGISWTLVSGKAPAGVTFPVNAATLHIVAPTVNTDGQALVLRATATDAQGNATVDQTVNLTPVPPPSVALTVWPGNGAPPAPGSGLLDPLQPVLVPLGGIFSGSAAATGTGALTYQWSTSPAAPIATATASSTTFTAPSTDMFLTVTVQVTDATGATATASRVVQVGAGFPTTSLNCGNPVFNDLVRQASANAGRAAGSLLDVSVPIGQPPIGVFNLGKLTFSGDCSTAPNLAFSGATFTLFGGAVGGTGVAGSATPTGLCLTGGQVSLSPELGLGPTTVGTPTSPLCISIDPADWGTPDPPVPDAPPPDPATPPRGGQGTTPPDPNRFRLPTISCAGGTSPISGSLSWSGAFPGINLAGPKLTTVKFDCGFLELTSTASAPWGDIALRGLIRRDGSFEAAVTTTGLRLFGSGANTELTGKLRRSAAGAITWSVGAHIPTPNVGIGALSINAVDVALSPTGFSLTGDGTVHPGGTAPDINVHLGGTITGQDEFTATATGSLASSWTVAPGLTIAAGSVTASIARAAGHTDFDLFLAASGDWPIVAPQLTLRQITARLSNRAAPNGCVAQAGDLWAQVTGTAHLDLGQSTPVIDLTAAACVGLSQPTLIVSTTANLNSWKPITGQDFTFSSIGFSATLGSGSAWTFDVFGDANYAGIRLAGRVRLITDPPALVIDVGGDLSGLHIPMLSSGHVVFATTPVTGYEPMPIAGVAAPPIDLDTGLTAFADITLPPAMRDALGKILNPPAPKPPVIAIPDTIRFTAALGSTSIRLEGSISFPAGHGLTLFATCPAEAPHPGGECALTDPMTTSLQLQSLFISIDTSGKLGFGGDAVIQFASGDGVTIPPPLPITAEASIDLTGPAISLALYTTADWPNAMGIEGLTLGNLAIQGGVSFATYPPVPTIGFGATIKQLPPDIADMLGIQSPQEPMTFVVNIAPTKPILQISLGQHDGKTFLKPIQPISAANADALTIDDANLIFAPLGGDVGSYHYEPGISLSFGGSLLGVTVSGLARISLSPLNMHAELDVGDIGFGTGSGATVLKATHLLFDATPTDVIVQASGGIDIAGGPRAQLFLDVEAHVQPPPVLVAASATFALDVSNWSIPFADTTITKLHIDGNLTGSLTSLPSGAFTAIGKVRTGSTIVNLAGSLTITNGRLTAANVAGSISGLTLFGVNFTGPGCPPISTPTGTIPATTSGVCLSAGFNPAASPPLSIGFAGTATVAGMPLDVTASFGPTGLHGTARLRSPDLGNPSVTGDIWFGSALAGITATDDLGRSRQVQPGDFRFAGAMNLPGVFSGSSLSGSLGRVNGHSWIEADGTLVLSGRQLANGHLDISSTGIDASGSFTLKSPFGTGPSLPVSLSGQLTYATTTTQLGFVLTATLGVQPPSADPAQRALAGASFTLRRGTVTGSATFFTATGDINLLGITGSFSGTVSSAGNFCLHADLSIDALSASGSGSIGNTCTTAGVATPGFMIDVTMNPVSTSTAFRFTGRISTGAVSLAASATDSRRLMLQGTHKYLAPVNNRLVQDWVFFTTSVSGSLNWSNTSGFSLDVDFSLSSSVRFLVLNVRASNPSAPNPTGSIYVDNFTGTLGLSFSNGALCATVPGVDLIPGVTNPICI